MNFVDSEQIEKKVQKMGFSISKKETDFVIVNTCTVTHLADRKSRAKINKHLKEGKKVIIYGCGPRTDLKTWEEKFPNCKIYRNIDEVLKYLNKRMPKVKRNSKLPVYGSTERTRKYIEIQNGCDTYCSYCIIPFARGKSVSRPSTDIITEIQNNEKNGFKEIVLTGINLAAWGASHTNKQSESKLGNLLEEILAQTSIPRIRISSVGPQFLNDKFFEVFANERICDHLHISIQSGAETVLKRMNRGHGVQEIVNVANKAKKTRKNVALTCDIIVGFPGETDTEFQQSIELIKQLKMTKIHIFPFSVRSGTAAEKMKPRISDKVKKNRTTYLKKIGIKLQQQFIEQNINSQKEVLWEKKGIGLTSNYIQVKNNKANINNIETVLLTKENVVY